MGAARVPCRGSGRGRRDVTRWPGYGLGPRGRRGASRAGRAGRAGRPGRAPGGGGGRRVAGPAGKSAAASRDADGSRPGRAGAGAVTARSWRAAASAAAAWAARCWAARSSPTASASATSRTTSARYASGRRRLACAAADTSRAAERSWLPAGVGGGSRPHGARAAWKLRRLKDRTARTYRDLAPTANYSPAQLAAAAAGTSCPTLTLVLAYARACGASPPEVAQLRALWAKADAARPRRARPAPRPSAAAAKTLILQTKPARGPGPVIEVAEPIRAYSEEPRPEQAKTAAQYIRQLGALRAWAGKPGHKEIVRRGGNRTLAASSMYDALSPTRTTLPPLETVTAIVRACAPGSVRDWVATWQAISLRAFEDAHPMAPTAASPRRPLRVVDGRRRPLPASLRTTNHSTRTSVAPLSVGPTIGHRGQLPVTVTLIVTVNRTWLL